MHACVQSKAGCWDGYAQTGSDYGLQSGPCLRLTLPFFCGPRAGATDKYGRPVPNTAGVATHVLRTAELDRAVRAGEQLDPLFEYDFAGIVAG